MHLVRLRGCSPTRTAGGVQQGGGPCGRRVARAGRFRVLRAQPSIYARAIGHRLLSLGAWAAGGRTGAVATGGSRRTTRGHHARMPVFALIVLAGRSARWLTYRARPTAARRRAAAGPVQVDSGSSAEGERCRSRHRCVPWCFAGAAVNAIGRVPTEIGRAMASLPALLESHPNGSDRGPEHGSMVGPEECGGEGRT